MFTQPSSGWANTTQTAKLTASDGWANRGFGNSVSIRRQHGGGRSANTTPAAPRGGLRVQRAGSGWTDMTQTAKLISSVARWYDDFGSRYFGQRHHGGGRSEPNSVPTRPGGGLRIHEARFRGWADMSHDRQAHRVRCWGRPVRLFGFDRAATRSWSEGQRRRPTYSRSPALVGRT